jgi:Virulence activator alpha C-term
MLRVFMLWLLDSTEAAAFFDDEIDIHRERLAGFEQTLADDERQRRKHGTAQGGIAFCTSLALEWAIRYEREYIDWATQTRDRITAGTTGWDKTREHRLSQSKTSTRP